MHSSDEVVENEDSQPTPSQRYISFSNSFRRDRPTFWIKTQETRLATAPTGEERGEARQGEAAKIKSLTHAIPLIFFPNPVAMSFAKPSATAGSVNSTIPFIGDVFARYR
jgi:hypothetical protein